MKDQGFVIIGDRATHVTIERRGYNVLFPDSPDIPDAYRGKDLMVLADNVKGKITCDGRELTGRERAVALKQYPTYLI